MSNGEKIKTLILVELFYRADLAGMGIANGASFEAFPGLEDCAAAYMATISDDCVDAAFEAFDRMRGVA